jgi:hypothetical protein
MRERVGSSCDIGTPKSVLQERFGSLVHFMQDMPEEWWPHGAGDDDNAPLNPQFDGTVSMEDAQYFGRRVAIFKQWLQQRPERFIVVVGHSAFFKRLSNARFKLPNCGIKEIRMRSSAAPEGTIPRFPAPTLLGDPSGELGRAFAEVWQMKCRLARAKETSSSANIATRDPEEECRVVERIFVDTTAQFDIFAGPDPEQCLRDSLRRLRSIKVRELNAPTSSSAS